MLGVPVCAVWLLVRLIRKEPKKIPAICIGVSFALMILGMSIDIENDKKRESQTVTVQVEAEPTAEPVETQTPEPTAAPTSTPNVTVAPVQLAKASIEDVKQILYDLFVDDYAYVEVKGDETSISVNIAENGIALAAILANSNDNFTEWREMKKGMQSLSEAAYKFVKDSGYEDTIVFLNLLNDQNKENALIMYMNGILISDAIDN